MSGEVWKYMPFTHKTKYEGKTRAIYIGPKVQQILKPYLERGKDDPKRFIFLRQSGKQYVGSVYDRQIAVACKKAGVPQWSLDALELRTLALWLDNNADFYGAFEFETLAAQREGNIVQPTLE